MSDKKKKDLDENMIFFDKQDKAAKPLTPVDQAGEDKVDKTPYVRKTEDNDLEEYKTEEDQLFEEDFGEDADELAEMEGEVPGQAKDFRKIRDGADRAFLLYNLSETLQTVLVLLPAIIITILLISLGVMAIRVTMFSVDKKKDVENIAEIRQIIDNPEKLESVNQNYMSEKLREILTQNDLIVFSNSLWDYSVVLNGDTLGVVPEGKTRPVMPEEITIKMEDAEDGKIVLLVREERKESPLPDDIVKIGMVTRGDAQDSVFLHTNVYHNSRNSDDIKGEMNEDGLITTYTYTVENVKKGDVIYLIVSDQLAAKIGLAPFNAVTIHAD